MGIWLLCHLLSSQKLQGFFFKHGAATVHLKESEIFSLTDDVCIFVVAAVIKCLLLASKCCCHSEGGDNQSQMVLWPEGTDERGPPEWTKHTDNALYELNWNDRSALKKDWSKRLIPLSLLSL